MKKVLEYCRKNLFHSKSVSVFRRSLLLNYWEPLYPGDVDFENNMTRHWVRCTWRSGYQAGEVGKIVEAYHYGIVFDKQDIQRMINTNLDVMEWRQGKPEFINSNGLGADHDTTGVTEWRATYGHSNDLEIRANSGQGFSILIKRSAICTNRDLRIKVPAVSVL